MATSDGDRPAAIALHTSWRGRFVAGFAPVLMLGLGGYGIAAAGFRVLPIVLTTLGLFLALVSLFDFPRFTVIGPDGIDRHCVLRTEHLAWHRVHSLSRPGLRLPDDQSDVLVDSGIGDLTPRRSTPPWRSGRSGLVARIGSRPYTLVDKSESTEEYDYIARSLRRWHPDCALRAVRPGQATAPTWLHKRRRGPAHDQAIDLLA